MKWYTAISSYSSETYFNMLEVAIRSCITNKAFKPHVVCDKITPRLKKIGKKFPELTIIEHPGAIFQEFVSQFKDDKKLANHLGTAGAYLRAEIPNIEQEDDVVLYTDVDVLFFDPREGPQDIVKPDFFAVAPEFDMNNWSYFNTGSMLINVNSMKKEYDNFLAFVVTRFKELIGFAHDQGAYNHLYQGRWNKLPLEYNWKPGWGINDQTVVLHWHGPKPEEVRMFFNGSLNQVNIDVDVNGLELYKKMIQRDTESYKHYLERYDFYTS